MFGIGVPELILILVVGLVVFGPGKLPEIGRAMGKTINEFKKITSSITLDQPAAEPQPAQPKAVPAEAVKTAATDVKQEAQPAPAAAAAAKTAEGAEPVASDAKA